jgi:hypothetical protein
LYSFIGVPGNSQNRNPHWIALPTVIKDIRHQQPGYLGELPLGSIAAPRIVISRLWSGR